MRAPLKRKQHSQANKMKFIFFLLCRSGEQNMRTVCTLRTRPAGMCAPLTRKQHFQKNNLKFNSFLCPTLGSKRLRQMCTLDTRPAGLCAPLERKQHLQANSVKFNGFLLSHSGEQNAKAIVHFGHSAGRNVRPAKAKATFSNEQGALWMLGRPEWAPRKSESNIFEPMG